MGDTIRKLADFFARFPGIGPRQAKRFVYHLLSQSAASRKELAALILKLDEDTTSCPSCMRFHDGKPGSPCRICADAERDASALMIVEKDVDIEQIERSGAYRGYYFVLGGRVPILDEKPESKVRLTGLAKRAGTPAVKEIIFALSATPEGEHTEHVIREHLRALREERELRFSVLGRGLSTGAELEYADPETLRSALKNRA
jgi:recombination protein RecR